MKAADIKEKKSFSIRISWEAWIISILTASAYVMGRGYHEAYMDSLGFNHVIYEKSVQDYWFYAFSALVDFFLIWLAFVRENIVIIVSISGFAILVYIIRWSINKLDGSIRVQTWRDRLSNNRIVRMFVGLLAWPVAFLFSVVNVPAFVVFILIFPGFVGEKVGQHVAERDMAIFSTNCNDPLAKRRCTSIKSGESEVMSGYVVATANGYVALMANGKPVSLPIIEKSFELHPSR